MVKKQTYLIFDKISDRTRIIVSILLVATGFVLQLSTKNILAGLPFIIACSVFNLLKNISIKRIRPKDRQWREVTPDKIEQLLVHCKKIKKFRSRNIGCIISVIAAIFVFSFIVPLLPLLFRISFPVVATIINAIILFAGLTFSGQRSAWMPYGLDVKAKIVKRMLDLPVIANSPDIQMIPYLEEGIHKDGSFPNDTRFLIKFKDAPDDFIGLQGQISINAVKGRQYPYFYIVLIAKQSFQLFERFTKKKIDNCVIERKKTSEVDVIVIRQHTTKTSGYHTNQNRQDFIITQGIKYAKMILD